MKLIPFLILLISFTLNAYVGPMKLAEKSFFKGTDMAYTTPSLSYINFKRTEALHFNPGYFWYNSFFFSTLGVDAFGNNIAPWYWDKKISVNSVYLRLVESGYMWMWNNLRLFMGVDYGFFWSTKLATKEMNENKAVHIGTNFEHSLGFSTGFLWSPWKLYFLMWISSASVQKNKAILNFLFDAGFNINDNWRVGAFIQSAKRNMIAIDNEGDDVDYTLKINMTPVYGAYRFYNNWWISLGFVLGSNIAFGPEGETSKENKNFGPASIYISIM